jgi:dephospho-CoA kinase
VVEAAILIEAGWFRSVDRIIVVVAQHSTQTSRLMAEHGLTEARATARIQAQLPAQDRLRYADFRVDGQAPLTETQQQVALIWEELVRLS